MPISRRYEVTRVAAVALLAFAFAGGACSQSVSEQYLLAAVNQVRAAHQLPLLQSDGALARAARRHAQQMAKRAGVEHRFAGEAALTARAAAAGVSFSLITENVAEAASAVLLHELWMHSTAHRANLLDPLVNTIGIGVVARDGELFGVEDFAHEVRQLTFTQQEQSVSALLASSGLRRVTQGENARGTCALATGFAGERKPWFVMRYTASDLGRLPEELEARLATGKYGEAAVGACASPSSDFASYTLAVLLYP